MSPELEEFLLAMKQVIDERPEYAVVNAALQRELYFYVAERALAEGRGLPAVSKTATGQLGVTIYGIPVVGRMKNSPDVPWRIVKNES